MLKTGFYSREDAIYRATYRERGFTAASRAITAAISHDEQALARDEDAIYRATYREEAAISGESIAI